MIEAHQSADGDVRKVKFAVADRTLDSKGRRTKSCKFLERPVQKLVRYSKQVRPQVHPRREAKITSSIYLVFIIFMNTLALALALDLVWVYKLWNEYISGEPCNGYHALFPNIDLICIVLR